MEPRLASSVLVSALIHRAQAESGFAAVLAKGDPQSGSLLVILAEKGRKSTILQRAMQGDGRYSWQPTGPQDIENEEEVSAFVARQRRYDPDLWLIELDVASAERFAAEMNEII